MLDEGWAVIDAEGMEFFAWVETHFPRALLQAVAAIEAICASSDVRPWGRLRRGEFRRLVVFHFDAAAEQVFGALAALLAGTG